MKNGNKESEAAVCLGIVGIQRVMSLNIPGSEMNPDDKGDGEQTIPVKSGKALSGKQQIQTWANLGIKDTQSQTIGKVTGL